MDKIRIIKLEIYKLKLHPDLKSKFPFQEELVLQLMDSIKARGYDSNFPVLANEDYILVDGHHRLEACKRLGLKRIWVIITSRRSVEQLSEISIRANKDRRHLTKEGFQKFVANAMPHLAKNGSNQHKKEGLSNDKPSSEKVLTRQDIAEATGKSLPTIYREISRQRNPELEAKESDIPVEDGSKTSGNMLKSPSTLEATKKPAIEAKPKLQKSTIAGISPKEQILKLVDFLKPSKDVIREVIAELKLIVGEA